MYSHLYAKLPSVDAYLERIGMKRPEKLDREYLDELIYQHQCHVPFDPLDVSILNKDIDLGIEHLFDKIVTNNRGGYCFEMNGLFCKLLQELGYDAYSIPCRVMRSVDTYGPVMHRATAINLDGKKLFCDVGFGGPMPPATVDFGMEDEWQDLRGEKFMFKKIGEYWYHLYRLSEESETNKEPTISLAVGTGEYDPVDYIYPNAACGVGPDARFRKNKKVSRRTPNGSLTLTDEEFSVVENHKKTVTPVESVEQYLDILEKEFGINIKEEYAALQK
ncbi:MAG: arylamine N-acetyltransferase [Anaerofustis stercorihominis]|nr:arylamine N-acetyltransferase [Anaerofustis stercorihominis]